MNSRELTERLLQFIWESPSCYHTAANVEKALAAAGYKKLSETEKFELHPGGRYYVMRNDSSLLAFRLPKKDPKGFHIVASHSDTPGFKLKEKPECREGLYVKLNVEKYGGMILSTWLDRPLAVAGRVILSRKNGLQSVLVDMKEISCVIPNLAIHFNREMNKGIEYNPQTDMQPLVALGDDFCLKKILADRLQAAPEDILGTDLFLYYREKGTFLGYEEMFIGSPRLDDTQCAFASLEGFLQAEPQEYINVYALFDNEEVGSRTRQGADSDFLETALTRIAMCLGKSQEIWQMVAGSFLLSADNGHALHPNHPEKYDPDNRPMLNGGIVIKYHGNQQYTTDAYTGAVVKALCAQEEIPCQVYANRSDIAGGSTLGNISISHMSIPTADIGLAQLAMHSAFEIAGAKDTVYMVKLTKAFYEQ